MEKYQSVRGMNDLLPDESGKWQFVESTLADVLSRYGYSEIRFPVLEKTGLFERSIGAVTDIVEKEMYSFEDRSGDWLTLRPEGTAGCVRACIQNGLLDRPQRLWYSGPMFRHERPQKGRLRQFHQFGVEIFGLDGPDIDAELIALTSRVWKELGIGDALELELNTLGAPASRAAHRAALIEFLRVHKSQLDEDTLRRMETNPLRVLDSKNPDVQDLLKEAPSPMDFLDPESKEHLDGLQRLLDALDVEYRVNMNLVRGLDYYGRTVFEWITNRLGAQGTVCGGGRYDGLVGQLGGRDTAALGLGIGVERLVLLVEEVNSNFLDSLPQPVDIYIVYEEQVASSAMQLSEQLRDQLPHMATMCHCGGGSFKSQFRRADRSGASVALVLGGEELARGEVVLKYLREDVPQESLSRTELLDRLRS